MSIMRKGTRLTIAALALISAMGVAVAQSGGGSGSGSSGGGASGSAGTTGGGGAASGDSGQPSYSIAPGAGETSAGGGSAARRAAGHASTGDEPELPTKPKIVRCRDGSVGDLAAGGCLGGR
ncbi:MAG TPA: hypothetical protein VGC51_08790 [Hansschlegelia sp.]